MARIRTIKPEFWTDAKIVQLPFEARLLFIGMWNFADDDGCLSDEPERIRMQVLPAEAIDAGLLVDLLVAAELVDRIDLESGESCLRIHSFAEHQKISHKTPTKFNLASGRKRSVPNSVRREISGKYGCAPGEEKEATCYYCGAPGKIKWWRLNNGRPSGWVSFSGLEVDHFIPESSGGEASDKNLVLACCYCNRSKKDKDGIAFVHASFRKTPEPSGKFPSEGKGKEGSTEAKASGAFAPISDQDKLWRDGVPWLAQRSGKDPDKVRPILGKWAKQHGATRVLEAIALAQQREVIEPIAFITAALSERKADDGVFQLRPLGVGG